MILARRKIRRALILTSFFMIVLKKHVNKREKTLHHDFVLFIYMYNVRNLNIERVQLKWNLSFMFFFRRSGILLTRIKVKYSSLEVCTCIEGSHWIQQKSIVFRLFFKFTTFLSFVFWLICSLIIQIQKYEVGKWKWWIQIVIKNHYRY